MIEDIVKAVYIPSNKDLMKPAWRNCKKDLWYDI
jgi:hypothetical protein